MNVLKRTFLGGFVALVGVTASSCGVKDTLICANGRQLNEDCDSCNDCISGLACENGKCRVVCESDADCGDSLCIDNRCVTKLNGQCTADSDCKNPSVCQKSQGKCENNSCVYDEIECNTPGANHCSEDNLTYITYKSTGTCDKDSGECKYDELTQNCDGDCLHNCSSCKDVDCPEVAEGGCKINGTCNPDTLECSYETKDNMADCELDDGTKGICNSSHCVDCLYGSSDAKIHCNQPPKDNGCYTAACVSGNVCEYTVRVGETCSEQRCEGKTLYQAATCDENGDCLDNAVDCPNYLKCKDNSSCYESCETDAECADGSYCYNNSCMPYLADGENCIDENDNNWCKFGSCCTSKLCNPNTAKCGDKCSEVGCPTGEKCDSTNERCCSTGKCCVIDGDCGGDNYFCSDNGDCLLKKGTACTKENGFSCETGHCADGVCCDEACDGSCEACNQDGTCETVTGKQDSDSCAAGLGCNGMICSCSDSGSCLATLGNACGNDSDCISGHCVDNVCCDSECSDGTAANDKCHTCGAYSSNGVGHCGYVKNQSDPRTVCGANNNITCQGSCSYSGLINVCTGTDYSCTTIDEKGNRSVPAGQICKDNKIITLALNNDASCANEIVSEAGKCKATQYFHACNGNGSCDSAKTGSNVLSQPAYAAAGTTYNNTNGGTSSSTSCQDTSICPPDNSTINHQAPVYKFSTCDGSGNCNVQTGKCSYNSQCINGSCNTSCSNDLTCAAGSYCVGGVCLDGAIGTSCEDSGDCDGKLQCDATSKTCRLSGYKESCSTNSDCATSAPYCVSGTCYAGASGDNCTTDSHCTYYCVSGKCNSGGLGANCIDQGDCSKVAPGQQPICSSSSKTCKLGFDQNCNYGYEMFCDVDLKCTSAYLCKKIDGQACSSGNDCASGNCVNKKCISYVGYGNRCDSTNLCKSGLKCYSGYCKKDYGQSCSSSYECVSPYICRSGICNTNCSGDC